MPQNRTIDGSVLARPLTAQTWLVYSLTFLPPILLLIIALIQTVVPVAFLLKDPLTVAEYAGTECCSVYYGLVSNFGILIWCSAAAISLFAGLILFVNRSSKADIIFLVGAGLLTGWLMLDDFFMVHEDVLPALGVPQPLTYLVYASFAAAYFALSWRNILTHRIILLAISVALLGTSVLLDMILHSESAAHVFTEDATKLLGICAWCGFHVDAALTTLQRSIMQ